jgi:GNAT superfamily N-acetyltransferase
MPEVSIRPFAGSDTQAVVDIWNAALRRDPIDTGRFVSWLSGDPDYWPGEGSGMLVAERGGKPAGFVRAIFRRSPNDRVGLEPELGWLPVLAVDPAHQRQGMGRTLLKQALDHLRAAKRRRVWVCGNSGSAPGYVFPGVDEDAYSRGLELLKRNGFVVDHVGLSMSRSIVDFELDEHHAAAWATGKDIVVEGLTPARVQDFLTFLAAAFPGDWNTAARGKIRSGRFSEVLIARRGDKVVGYCQWEGEHFGPFGVSPAERSNRIGAKLFIESVRRIRAADGRTVWFNWADPDAARFYERFGLSANRRFAIMRCDL